MKNPTSPDTIPGFAALLRTALGDHLDPGATGFVDMMAEDGVMEFPFATADQPLRLVGRAAVRQHLASLSGLLEIDSFSDLVVHASQTPGTFILQFACTGRGAATGLPYRQRYISVITLEQGRIATYLDYWNPLVVMAALGASDPIAALPGRSS
ncbi:nuclear transport factor 2 family protein [Devosia beringensis]|uniref:nuclear transport factor 2 family protein n=1 Tax=Devosia beringensis TaxID=2657486 RepID=UPI00186B9767|nr:nuclear transport factor 2 family protein [Devosia beringensis]